MFWKDNQTTSSTITTLLEDENVSLNELLDEDDILQECKSQNKKLVEYLARPNIMYELIQLVTEEQHNMELIYRYRRSAVSCEIIASRVSSISESMAGDTKVLGKLYSFLEAKPPLNPLLASFFAKTIEVLLSRNTNQDWYAYQVMCLQVMEFFKSCPSFLPKLLEHFGTSAIMNCLQHITQVPVINMKQDILYWLDSHGLIEKLISMICGLYTHAEVRIAVPNVEDNLPTQSLLVDTCEKQLETLCLDQPAEQTTDQNSSTFPTVEPTPYQEVQQTPVTESDANPTDVRSEEAKESLETPELSPDESNNAPSEDGNEAPEEQKKNNESPVLTETSGVTSQETSNETDDVTVGETKPIMTASISNGPVESRSDSDLTLPPKNPEIIAERLLKSQAMNAAHFLSQFIMNSRDPSYYSKSFSDPLYEKCISEDIIGLLLDSMFSSPVKCRRDALVYGIGVLLTLLNDVPGQQPAQPCIEVPEIQRIASVILPWLPQFKQALIDSPETKVSESCTGLPVGIARLTIANLMVVLVSTDSAAVAEAMMEHKIFDILLDMFFIYKWNNFLHTSVENIIAKAFNVQEQKELYRKHLLIDCNLVDRITSAWTENDFVQWKDMPRSGNMGHIIQLSNHIQECLSSSPSIAELISVETRECWGKLVSEKLNKVNLLHDSCLGGQHPINSNSSNNDDLQHMQQTHSSYADSVSIHDINYNDADDPQVDADEQMFINMCESTASSLGDGHNNSSDDWTHANFTSVTGKSGLSTSDKNEEEASSIDCAFFGLANLSSSLGNWIKQNDCHEWDEAEDIRDITAATGLPVIAASSASPWGDVTNLTSDQAGWADFSLQETVGISNVPNTFTCEAFAAFDQQISPESNRVPCQTMELLESPSSVADLTQRMTSECVNKANSNSNEISVNLLENVAPLIPNVIVAGEGTPTFADMVRHQPIAQKDNVPLSEDVAADSHFTTGEVSIPEPDEVELLKDNKNEAESAPAGTAQPDNRGVELSRDDNANPTVPGEATQTPAVHNQR